MDTDTLRYLLDAAAALSAEFIPVRAVGNSRLHLEGTVISCHLPRQIARLP